MATIGVLGTGLLGAGFAESLLRKGHTVRVWNRTAAKCDPLVAMGAVRAADPADAARGAERVHLVLSDDSVVDPVIDALLPGLTDGAPIVDHSTNLPAGVDARVRRLGPLGVRYLHAPVFMGPANSKSATGLMLVSGDPMLVDALTPALATMTGKVLPLGNDPSRAATVKITGNGMLVMLTAAMGDLFAIGAARGMEPSEVLALFEVFSPTPAGMGRRALDAGKGPVGFEMAMARKDVRLMIQTAGAENLMLLPAIAAAMDRALAQGRGAEDFASFIR